MQFIDQIKKLQIVLFQRFSRSSVTIQVPRFLHVAHRSEWPSKNTHHTYLIIPGLYRIMKRFVHHPSSTVITPIDSPPTFHSLCMAELGLYTQYCWKKSGSVPTSKSLSWKHPWNSFALLDFEWPERNLQTKYVYSQYHWRALHQHFPNWNPVSVEIRHCSCLGELRLVVIYIWEVL